MSEEKIEEIKKEESEEKDNKEEEKKVYYPFYKNGPRPDQCAIYWDW